MRFSLPREALLKPLQQVVGVVERRQTLPVLSNLLVNVGAEGVSFTGTDLEVEMVARTAAENLEAGEITIPARKLFDICRALPDGVKVKVEQSGERVSVSAGRSRFTLSTLPASEFPVIESIELVERISLPEATLKDLIARTAFAMANQDVRYYLNGLLLDVRDNVLRCVATDGHRLALAETRLETRISTRRQIIIPRKGVLELQGLFESGEGLVDLELGRNHLRLTRGGVTFTSKLIDGRFPDYEAVIPIGADKDVRVGREELRFALQRAAILSNEKYRGVKLDVSPNRLRIVAHNPEQEEAVEELEVTCSVAELSVGFNVNYLMDALAALSGDEITLSLRDAQSSCLLRKVDSDDTRHVVMPLRL
ncbi:MAG: DNA polymerase III subunit beta [Dokdonella sp.]|jgi:DNA polymerase III subunit beta|uniref:DNA polymerase III subunit beta n=1 Tax=Dokdonella sp. TaxID=2291710 RepID=UPI001B543CAE|nr:DNA polymerase III subunit beta [Dokdonella sp.]MCC6440404.1 DNA polymerase III subunit beta [Rhodanobacteraceae bacterium]MBK8123733.1 DNA polymerase III subunit beta [Dokdonella sp.]MBP6325962.1 DNA polymerase III subunit beta [Dokdonella sp.]MBP6328455.1 DNA polymerase III subunit beta [Dokdonella sp.]HNV07437.1 DNA polymerase III subunit beta [Dokdonella sp.]